MQVPILAYWLGIEIGELIGLWEAPGLEADGLDKRDPSCKAANIRVEHLIFYFHRLVLVLGGMLKYVTYDEHKLLKRIVCED